MSSLEYVCCPLTSLPRKGRGIRQYNTITAGTQMRRELDSLAHSPNLVRGHSVNLARCRVKLKESSVCQPPKDLIATVVPYTPRTSAIENTLPIAN
jgi:hypothetical protein